MMLYYIHGYMSGPNSTKGTLFEEKLNAIAIKYRDCEPEDLVISECINRINKTIENDENAILIGSSLGGLLAARTALENPNVKQIILLNPAIIPISVDISKIQGMPYKILEGMQDERLFKNKIASKIHVLLGLEDDVVPNSWGLEFAKAQSAIVESLHDDHQFSRNLMLLPEIISKIIN